MIYLVIFVLLVWLWIISEWINAPLDNTKHNDTSTKSNDTNNQEI